MTHNTSSPRRSHRRWIVYLVFTCFISFIPIWIEWIADSDDILKSGEIALIALVLAAGTLGDSFAKIKDANVQLLFVIIAFLIYTFGLATYIPCRFETVMQSLSENSVRVVIATQLFLLPTSVLTGCIAQFLAPAEQK